MKQISRIPVNDEPALEQLPKREDFGDEADRRYEEQRQQEIDNDRRGSQTQTTHEAR